MARTKPDIRFLVLDIDGVLTDGGMYYSESGDEFKKFNTKDGLAIRRLTKSGMPVAFLSNGKNKNLIRNRAELLGVQYVYVGNEEKLGVLDTWRKKLKLDWKHIAYIGDDVNDLKVMAVAGFTAAPSDAVEKVKKAAAVVLKKKGGDACVREFIERFMMSID